MAKHYYVREATVKYRRTESPSPGRVFDSRDVANMLRAQIGANMQESMCVVALDTRHNVIAWSEVARGGVSFCSVAMCDVFRVPIIVGACAIVLAHNHPSGDPSPSPEDVALTQRVKEGAALLGFQLLDHVVITETSQASLLDLGLL